jgi:hypothetical protein
MQNARIRLLGVVACVLLAVAGCTSGSSGRRDSPGLTSPRPSQPSRPSSAAPSVPSTGPHVRPGERPPVLAALGKTNSVQGAVQFARYWFEALDWGYATTSSVLARELYLPSCTDCVRFMKNFDDPREDGLYYRGGRLAIVKTATVSEDEHYEADQVVDVTIRVAAMATLDSAGSVLVKTPAIAHKEYRVWLDWSASGWHVAQTKAVVHE